MAAVAALAIFGAWQVRKRHTLDELVQNNEIAGFKFGVIGVLYAVVLGMAVVAVWEDFKDAVSNAETEANLVGDLYRDGAWINEALVSQGWAWHYTRYSDHPALARAEREARAARRGLWRDPHPTPPWTWRQRHPRGDQP